MDPSKPIETPSRVPAIVFGITAALGAIALAGVMWSRNHRVAGIAFLAVGLRIAVHFLARLRRDELEKEETEAVELAAVASPSGGAWRALLDSRGLGRFIPRLEPLVRPAVRLSTRRASTFELGESRIGGEPDAPAGFAWPRFRGDPMTFLAQVDLTRGGGGELPAQGHLLFFAATQGDAFGLSRDDRGWCVVVHVPQGVPLARQEAPADLDRKARFEACAVEFTRYDDLPDLDDDHPLEAEFSDEDVDNYYAVSGFLAAGKAQAPSHKLLGHAQAIQGPVAGEVAYALRGGEAPAQHGEARTWRLLLQLDSDAATDMLWGDAGRLYVMIRAEDLAAARFDAIWAVMQCH